MIPDGPSHRSGRRIVLLASQAFALGLTTAWVLIPASAIFLTAYGADRLPITYIGAGVAGIASSAALARAFRRRPLAEVATRVLAGVAVTLLVAWAVLSRWHAVWVSFALLVVVPIVIPTGFMFIVGQAGSLLDVRALKASYARVVAGFAMGFVLGGVAGPRLIAALGGTEHLLAAAAGAAALFLALLVVTRRTFPAALSTVEHQEGTTAAPSVRDLSRDRFVMLIVAFQVLSAVESQWLDFLVFARAAERYDDSEELARFVSQFTAIAYGADIVFLLVLAGLLLRRFGLRYGLTANSGAVLTLLVAIMAASVSFGSGATVVFVLVVAARVADLVCSDGTSRTSLSAAYQVVPTRLRLAAPAFVEGLAVPVAIAGSGAVLLVLGASAGTDGLLLPLLTAAVVATWAVVAMALYRGYGVNLLARLRHRELQPAELVLDGGRDLDVVAGMLESSDDRDVRLALDTLARCSHPSLPAHLHRLVTDPRPGVRAGVLDRLVWVDGAAAADAARTAMADPDPDVLVAAIGVLGAGGERADLAAVSAHAGHPSPEVRGAVAVAMAHLGDEAVRTQVAGEVIRRSRSQAATDRLMAAQVLGSCGPETLADRSPLVELVRDRDHDVAVAALAAVRWPEDAAVLDAVADRLTDPRTAGAAVAALATSGDAAVRLAGDAIGSEVGDRRAQESWVKVCRAVGGAEAAAVVLRYVDHPDRDVGLAALDALGAIEPGSGGGSSERFRGSAVVTHDLTHAIHVLGALASVDQDPRAGLLRAALADELGLLRRRVLAALSLGYGSEGVRRVGFQLAQRDPRSVALALEWLDVMLRGSDRAAIGLLEPEVPHEQRIASLRRWFPAVAPVGASVLRELVEDPERRWRRPWISACALHLAWQRWVDGAEQGWVVAFLDRAPAGGGADILGETVAGIGGRRAAEQA